MTDFIVSLEGIEELERDLELARVDLALGCAKAVAQGCREAVAQARATHPYQDRTGRLTESIEVDWGAMRSSHEGAEGAFVARAPYAGYVENGTRPHVIRPKNKLVLHWEEPQGDHHFAREVQHPGTRPLPFMGPAYLKCESVMIREIEAAVARAEARCVG